MPHDHIDQEHGQYEIKASKSLSLADIVKLALTHNIGVNHLEEFKNCKKLEFNKNLLSVEFIFSPQIANLKYYSIVIQESRPDSTICPNFLEGIYNDHPLRAPPAIS